MPKVIFDTNVLLSVILFPGIATKQFYECLPGIIVIYSTELIEEMLQKLYGKFRATEEAEYAIRYILLEQGKEIQIKSHVSICRDPKDNYLLALAQDSQADYLVTGDKDLLVLNTWKKTQIISLKQFSEDHKVV